MEKYTYIRKTITWENRRYEVRGKTEQEACDKLAELVASLNRGELPPAETPQWTNGFSNGRRHTKPLPASPKRVWASMMRSITAILAPPLGH